MIHTLTHIMWIYNIWDQFEKLKALQEKCLLVTKNFWRTQKTLSKNLICDSKIKPSQILGKMWNICDQQKMVSPIMGKPIEPWSSFPLQDLGFVWVKIQWPCLTSKAVRHTKNTHIFARNCFMRRSNLVTYSLTILCLKL